MKKIEKLRYAAIGALIAVLLVQVTMPVNAASLAGKYIQVFTGINIYVDDIKLSPKDANGNSLEAFVYNGTTYLPVRAVSEAVGKTVQWDSKSGSVYLGRHTGENPAVWLKDLDYFSKSRSNIYNADMKNLETQMDNLGKMHSNCVGGGEYTYSYKLNGQYSKITGSLFMLYDTRSVEEIGKLKIYGDGELLYEAKVAKGIEPIEFSVDLTGVLETCNLILMDITEAGISPTTIMRQLENVASGINAVAEWNI